MPPSTVIQHELATRPEGYASRLIPGVAVAQFGVPRKRPHSVRSDGPLWAGEKPQAFSRPSRAAPLLNLMQAVLPGPAVPGQAWSLLANVLADFLLVFVNFLAVSHLHLALRRNLAGLAGPSGAPPPWLGFVLLYGVLITLLGYSEGLYRTDLVREPRDERRILIRTLGWATLLAGTLIYLFGIDRIPPTAVIASAGLNSVTMLAWRRWQRSRAAQRAQNGRAARNVLIVGAGRLGHEVADCLNRNPQRGRVIRGFLDDNWRRDPDGLGTVDDLARIARAEFADEIILTLPHDSAITQKVIREARRNRLDVKLVPDLSGFESQSAIIENFGPLPVLSLHEEPIPSGGLFLKRAFDVVGSTLGLALAGPVMALIALVIRLDSPGLVFYRAARVGRKGRCFVCFKFRTMVADAEGMKERLRPLNQRQGAFFKIGSDPRITRAGRFLRRYSLDELPQLWNVLKGEMSLVGPRPHPLDDFARYDLEHLRRLDVTPGITGLWQVTARQDPSFRRSMALDLEYIEQWSLGLDLRILLKTLSVVLEGSGA